MLRINHNHHVQALEQNRRNYGPVVPASKNAVHWSGYLIVLGLFLAACVVVGPASAYSTPESITAAGKLYVSGVSIDPKVFFTGESGTATFYVTNGNANESISVNHANFGDMDIRRTSSTYDSSANIGPLQTRSFVFSITTAAREGWYYPSFSLSLRDAPENLYYITPVRVENTPVVTTIISQPDTFTRDQKDPITIQIANPRENDVKNVVLEVTGDGITATPSKFYIGTLASGSSVNRTVSINPTKETTLRISLSYDNGDNSHTGGTDLPVTFGINKKKADLVISNIKVTRDGSVFHATGDVTNTGLTTANGVSVTPLSPAEPKNPYPTYVVGLLKADDFGSFEVTFAADGITNVPFQVSYRDVDGNVILSPPRDISISSTGTSGIADKPSDSPLLVPVISFIAFLVIVGGYLYVKRKKSQ